MSKFFDVTIGADPEFCVRRNDGSFIEADRFGSTHEEIGADGNGMTFEIRPNPSANPLEVVTNISRAMNLRVTIQPDLLKYKWQAGSLKGEYALGGHIHFGTKRKISARAGSEILMHFLAPLLLLVEDETEASERRKPTRRIYNSIASAYGKALEFRIQPHGFEYRMPSSWLTSPQMAAAALCLAKVVMSEAINNKSLSPTVDIHPRHINLTQTAILRQKYTEIWDQITKMALYPTYKKELTFLKRLIDKNKNWYQPMETRDDIRKAWDVKRVKNNFLTRVTMDSIWGKV